MWTLRTLQAVIPPDGMAFVATTLNGRLLLFCVGLSVASGLVFGLYPAVRFSRPDLAGQLRQQTAHTTATRAVGLLRKSLVTMQTAVAVLLLVVAGLFGRTLVNLTRVDLGMQTGKLVTLSVMPKLNGYDDARFARFFDQLAERLATVPGVALVSAATVPAIGGSSDSTSLAIEGFVPPADDVASSRFSRVGPGYFRTLGIPLVTGREFTNDDDLTSQTVAIFNESFVHEFLPDQNPLARRFGPGRRGRTELDLTIVGVVRDAKYASVRENASAVFYVRYRQSER